MKNEDYLLHKQETKEGGIIAQKIPKVFLELLIGATYEEKDKVKELLDEIQKQISSSKYLGRRVRATYHLRPEEMSKEDQEKWLLDASHSYYYKIITKLEIGPTFVKNIVDNIISFEKSYLYMKNNQVRYKKVAPAPEEQNAKSDSEPTSEPEQKTKSKPKKSSTT
jgi:hypothetical protein